MRWALGAVLLAVLLAASCGDEDPGADAEGRSGGDVTAPAATVSTAGTEPAVEARGALLAVDRSPFPGGRIFSPDSPFNTPLPEDPPVHPQSEAIVAAMAARDPAEIVISFDEFTVAGYLVGEAAPRGEVALTADWAPFGAMRDVPLVPDARPDPSDDGSLALIDLGEGYVYDFWQVRNETGVWSASWGNRLSLDSDGIYPTGLSARGSGFSLLAGLIWPHELVAGEIDHALLFTYHPVRGGVLVPPATENDGTSDDPLALPEGARLQLDPAFDVDGMDAPEGVKTIARALQRYGMILGDVGGLSVVELEIVHPRSFGFETAAELVEATGIDLEVEDGYGYAWQIPLTAFRVIDFEPVPLDEVPIAVADESIYAEPRDVE